MNHVGRHRVRASHQALALAALSGLLLGSCSTEQPVVTAPTASTAPAPMPSPVPTAKASPSPTPTADPVPDPYAVHESAESLALVLGEAEQALRDDATSPADHATWAWVQQAAYRQLVDRPEWDDAVRAALLTELVDVFEHNLLAGRELRALTKPRDQLPPWRIIEPPPVEVLLDAYVQAADAFGIDWTYLAAIHLIETRMGRIEGDSTAGARGPMQFLPSTWDAYGEGDILDPHDAIRAAARYLAAHEAPADMDGALWAYNHSDRYVAAVQSYAAVMRAEPEQYRTYHGWQVYYRLVTGDEVLEVGWDNT